MTLVKKAAGCVRRALKALTPSAIEKQLNGGKCGSSELRRRQLAERERRKASASASVK